MRAGRAFLVLLLLWSGGAAANDFRTLPDYMRAMASVGTPLAASANSFFALGQIFQLGQCSPSRQAGVSDHRAYANFLEASQQRLDFTRRNLFPLGVSFNRVSALDGSLPEYSAHLLRAVETVLPHMMRNTELLNWYASTRNMRNDLAAASCRDAVEIQGAFIYAYNEYRQRLDTYRKWIELLMASATNRPRYGDLTDLVPSEFTRIPQQLIAEAALVGFISPQAPAVTHRQALAQSRGQLLIRIHPDTAIIDAALMAIDLSAIEIPFALRKGSNSGEADLAARQFTVYYFERHTDAVLTFDEIPRLVNFARRFGEVWRQSLRPRN